MKKMLILTVPFIIVAICAAYGQTNNPVIDSILSAWSPRAFTDQAVTDDQIDQIIRCGIKAPSARNRQPWHFTVVKDTALCEKVIPKITAGNVIIVISGTETGGADIEFDCGLATENMFLAAEGLGLGGRIYTGPVKNVNDTLKEALEIPAGYRVVSLLRVGNMDKTVDAATAATPRKEAKEIVNYK